MGHINFEIQYCTDESGANQVRSWPSALNPWAIFVKMSEQHFYTQALGPKLPNWANRLAL